MRGIKEKRENNHLLFKLINKRLIVGVILFTTALFLINVITIKLAYKDTKDSILIALGGLYIIINILSIIILTKVMEKVFKPLNKNIKLLKHIVKQNAEIPKNLDTLDEFQQLESLTNSIYNSINNKIKETRQLIYYDSLTGLPNRYFLETEVEALMRSKETFVLIFIDLDKFRNINNMYGYSIGDAVLGEFGRKIQKLFGNKGMIFRHSGDEFVAIYTEYTDKKSFLERCKMELLDKCDIDIGINELKIEISFSVGCAVCPEDGVGIPELLRNSHFVMNENKKNKNQLDIFFNQELYDKMLRQIEIKNSFKEAMIKQEFELYFQPIYKNNEIVKCEVLIRWFSKKFGFISPVEFISYAEEAGQIISLGNWIIEQSFKHYNVVRSKYNKNIEFSINVSGLQLCENGFANRVHNMANSYGISKSNIIFEITENILIHHNEIVMKNLDTLKEVGFKIALDDFGTGYSSFSYLERFDLDILKIDKSFIDDKAKAEEYEIVRHLINIAHAMDLEVVVEGVETKEQYKILESISCDYYQGYYFSKPLEFEKFIQHIEEK